MSQDEKDKLDEDCKNGKKIVITVGIKIGKPLKEEQKITHSLKWKQDNIIYQLTDKSNELSYKEISKMAKSIINLK